MKHPPEFLLKIIPRGILSKQARKPSGLMGKYIMAPLFEKGNADLNDLIFDTLDLRNHDHILDIGFGPGALIHRMARHVPGATIRGLDFSRAMIQEATKKNHAYIAEGRVYLREGDCQSMPYEDGIFDKVSTVNTIYFWNEPSRNLKEIHRVLAPGGKAILGFRSREQMKSLPLSRKIFNTYTPDEVTEFMTDTGFNDVYIVQKEGIPFISYCAVGYK